MLSISIAIFHQSVSSQTSLSLFKEVWPKVLHPVLGGYDSVMPEDIKSRGLTVAQTVDSSNISKKMNVSQKHMTVHQIFSCLNQSALLSKLDINLMSWYQILHKYTFLTSLSTPDMITCLALMFGLLNVYFKHKQNIF